MSELMHEAPITDLKIIQGSLNAAGAALASLAVAESLTDPVALRLLSVCGIENPENFLQVIHVCDFVVHLNTEWRLATPVRDHLMGQIGHYKGLSEQVHRELLAISAEASDHAVDAGEVPLYLVEGPGKAYHTSALNPQIGLAEYSRLAQIGSPRVGWWASRLAREQQHWGVLPDGAIEIIFLNGMVAYKEGRHGDAIGMLREVAKSEGISLEIAVAMHLVGRYDAQRNKQANWGAAIKMLRRSKRMGEELGDPIHVAQVEHTLAISLVLRDPKNRREESLKLLQSSLATLEHFGDTFGVAQVLHTLGQAHYRRGRGGDFRLAEQYLRRSLEIGEALGYRQHQARVLRSLSKVVKIRNAEEGDRLEVKARAMFLDLRSSGRQRNAATAEGPAHKQKQNSKVMRGKVESQRRTRTGSTVRGKRADTSKSRQRRKRKF